MHTPSKDRTFIHLEHQYTCKKVHRHRCLTVKKNTFFLNQFIKKSGTLNTKKLLPRALKFTFFTLDFMFILNYTYIP